MQNNQQPRSGIIRKEATARAVAHMEEICDHFVIIGKAADGGTVVAARGAKAEVDKLVKKAIS